jgi:DNA-binding XRE family transcriptional regulator
LPASRPMDELRRQAALLIVAHLDKITVAQAASDLKTSRQAVYDIKKGKYCPSLSLVQRACEVWGLKFEFRGILIDNTTLKAKTDTPPAILDAQGDLLEALGHLDSHNFEVIATKPMGNALDITVRLTIPAHRTA